MCKSITRLIFLLHANRPNTIGQSISSLLADKSQEINQEGKWIQSEWNAANRDK